MLENYDLCRNCFPDHEHEMEKIIHSIYSDDLGKLFNLCALLYAWEGTRADHIHMSIIDFETEDYWEELKKEAKEEFEKIDVSGDGKLSREEFELYLKDADEEYDEEDIEIMMEEVYDRLDSEGKGYITFDEYFDACYADDSDDDDDDDDSDE